MEYENDGIKIIPKRRQVMLKSQKFESHGWILITIRALRKTFCQIEFLFDHILKHVENPRISEKKFSKHYNFGSNFNFERKNTNFFVTFPDSCDIQKLRLLIQRDLRKFLQHKFWNCIEIRLQSLTGPVS
jgi:hypothetical protein